MAAAGAAGGLAVGQLFFRGSFSFVPLLPGSYILFRVAARKYARRRKRQFTEELKDYLLSVSGWKTPCGKPQAKWRRCTAEIP